MSFILKPAIFGLTKALSVSSRNVTNSRFMSSFVHNSQLRSFATEVENHSEPISTPIDTNLKTKTMQENKSVKDNSSNKEQSPIGDIPTLSTESLVDRNQPSVDINNPDSYNGFVDSLLNIIDSNKKESVTQDVQDNISSINFLADPVLRKIYNQCKRHYVKEQNLAPEIPIPASFDTEFLKMCQLEAMIDPSKSTSYHIHKLDAPSIDLKKEIDFENISKDFEFIKPEETVDEPLLSNLIDDSHLDVLKDTSKCDPKNIVIHDIIYKYKYLIDQIREAYESNGKMNDINLETTEELKEDKIDIPLEEIKHDTKNINDQNLEATGKRKESSARVILSKGNGQVTINHVPLYKYFSLTEQRENIIAPFLYTHLDITQYNVKIHVAGGGTTGQSEAIRLGISKCIASLSQDNYDILKAADFLYRDPRTVERKKAGRRKARKPQQWVKR
ncbi:hypothetical protein WA158_001099 [Blastocystis sp. Blastoise]